MEQRVTQSGSGWLTPKRIRTILIAAAVLVFVALVIVGAVSLNDVRNVEAATPVPQPYTVLSQCAAFDFEPRDGAPDILACTAGTYVLSPFAVGGE